MYVSRLNMLLTPTNPLFKS